MKRFLMTASCFLLAGVILAGGTDYGFTKGKAEITSFSTMVFNAEGILFVGDSKSGKIFAFDFEENEVSKSEEGFEMAKVEEKIAAFLGTDKDNVVIHDMAVNPVSQNIYLAVSRNNAKDIGFWKLPNDLGYANILLRISKDASISEVSLDNVSHSSIVLPNIKSEGPTPSTCRFGNVAMS